MGEQSAELRAFKFFKGNVQRIQGRKVYVKDSSGETLQLADGTLAHSLQPGQELVLVTGRSWKLHRILNPGTGELFCRQTTGTSGKIFLGLLFGLTGGIPVLGPMIVAGILLWVVFLYLPKAIFSEPYAGWQLVWALTALVALFTALALENTMLLHMISVLVGFCSAAFYYRFLELCEQVIDNATLEFAHSLGHTSLKSMKRVSIFVLPTRDWRAVES